MSKTFESNYIKMSQIFDRKFKDTEPKPAVKIPLQYSSVSNSEFINFDEYLQNQKKNKKTGFKRFLKYFNNKCDKCEKDRKSNHSTRTRFRIRFKQLAKDLLFAPDVRSSQNLNVM